MAKSMHWLTKREWGAVLLTISAVIFAGHSVAFAAPLTYSTDTNLSVAGVTLTIKAGSVANSVVVNTNTIVIGMSSSTGGTFTLVSTSTLGSSVVGSGADGTISYICPGGTPTLTITAPGGSASYTITPQGTSCSASGQFGSGGSIFYVPSTPPAPAPAPVTNTPATVSVPAAPVAAAPAAATISGSATAAPALPYAQPKTAAEIQANLNVLLAILATLQGAQGTVASAAHSASVSPAGSYQINLSIGARGGDVTALQNFLKSQGTGIYPEGTISGYFGTLTQKAVQRFQVKYGIAWPGKAGYGRVGPATRAKINSMLGL